MVNSACRGVSCDLASRIMPVCATYISFLDAMAGEAYGVFLWEEFTPRGNVVQQGTERRGWCACPACTGKPKVLPRSPPYLSLSVGASSSHSFLVTLPVVFCGNLDN